MNKKAQTYRNDLLVWYIGSFVLVIVTVGALYSFGILGDGGIIGSSTSITAAAVADTQDVPKTNVTNSTIEIENSR